ncbi:hypothetical protein ACFPRL_25620 [Pseudoclavibacter helvolus]
MADQEYTVAGRDDVRLERIRALAQGETVPLGRVLGHVGGGTPVADEEGRGGSVGRVHARSLPHPGVALVSCGEFVLSIALGAASRSRSSSISSSWWCSPSSGG